MHNQNPTIEAPKNMWNFAITFTECFFLVALIVLIAGKPDLLDAIRMWIDRH